MAAKSCKNCALNGAEWCRCNDFIVPRDKRGECIDWEPKTLWDEFRMNHREPVAYEGAHLIKRNKPLKKLPSIEVFYETDY